MEHIPTRVREKIYQDISAKKEQNMKIELLPKDLNYYKANLHSHSRLSDGGIWPEEMKAAYKAQGYSILAVTDHSVFIPHNDLTEPDFLMLNGLEYEIVDWGNTDRHCHFNAIAGSPDTVFQPLYHRTKYVWAGGIAARAQIKYDESLPDFEREYSHECINTMMKTCKDLGFFVFYNHPCWSMEHYPDYMGYNEMHAMEIVNYGSVEAGYPEFNEQVYDDMLTGGKRVFCVATDDNHTVKHDAFGAFTVIGAKELKYESVMDSLFKGCFYASTGAKIDAIYIEDGKICVEAPDAKEIRIFTGFRKAYRKIGTKDAPAESLSVALPDSRCKYFRVTVTDFDGNRAYSNAYFFDELGITLAEPQ